MGADAREQLAGHCHMKSVLLVPTCARAGALFNDPNSLTNLCSAVRLLK
jgi:hypothetical protein